MYTIETGFNRVKIVAFSSEGRVAVLGDGIWEVWSLPPGIAPGWSDWNFIDDGERGLATFGLVFDPRTGNLLLNCKSEGVGIFRCGDPADSQSSTMGVPGGPLRVFAISPSGDRLVCGCELWNGRTPKQSVDAQLVSFTRGGKQKHWSQSAVLEGDGFVFSEVAFFANGKRFASVEWSKRKQGREYHVGDVPTLRVHDAKSLDELDATTFKESAKDLVVCGNSLVVRGEKSFRVWDGGDLSTAPVEVKTGKAPLAAVAADPQGRFVLTATSNAVSVWDASSWSVSKTYEWAAGKTTCLAVSPDGLLGAAGTATGKVIVWDIE